METTATKTESPIKNVLIDIAKSKNIPLTFFNNGCFSFDEQKEKFPILTALLKSLDSSKSSIKLENGLEGSNNKLSLVYFDGAEQKPDDIRSNAFISVEGREITIYILGTNHYYGSFSGAVHTVDKKLMSIVKSELKGNEGGCFQHPYSSYPLGYNSPQEMAKEVKGFLEKMLE